MESTLAESTVTGIGGLNVLVLLLLASFAVDRVATATLFLLGFVPWWERRLPDPATVRQDPARAARVSRNRRLVRALLAVALAMSVVLLDERLRVLFALGVVVHGEQAWLQHAVDVVLTVIVLVAGSDLLGRLLDVSGRGDAGGAPAPVEIKGTLVLESGREPTAPRRPPTSAGG